MLINGVTSWGNLRDVLRSTYRNQTDLENRLTIKHKLVYACQIVSAMVFLEEKNIVHDNLCA